MNRPYHHDEPPRSSAPAQSAESTPRPVRTPDSSEAATAEPDELVPGIDSEPERYLRDPDAALFSDDLRPPLWPRRLAGHIPPRQPQQPPRAGGGPETIDAPDPPQPRHTRPGSAPERPS